MDLVPVTFREAKPKSGMKQCLETGLNVCPCHSSLSFQCTSAEVGTGSTVQQQLGQVTVTNLDRAHERRPLKAQPRLHVHTYTHRHLPFRKLKYATQLLYTTLDKKRTCASKATHHRPEASARDRRPQLVWPFSGQTHCP